MHFDYTEIDRYHSEFEESLRRIIPICSDPLRTGAFCSIGNEKGLVLVTFPLLLPPVEKWEKYHRLAGKKVWCLGQHPDHMFGRESMNSSLEEFGGAFRTAPYGANGLIIAVSGLPLVEEDEAVGMYGFWQINDVFLMSEPLRQNMRTNIICNQLCKQYHGFA
ncbi:MAG: hypothetical protein WCI57_02335 [Candidatus Berkelbacteria bacterium]